MRRTIAQILTLSLFLFLAAFSSVWFSEDKEKPESFAWTAKTASKTLGLFDGLARLASPASNSFASGVREEVALIGGENTDIFADRMAAQVIAGEAIGTLKETAAPLQTAVPNEGFFGFVRDVFAEAPERYLDAKLYNRGLKDFFSFYWLQVKDSNQ
ncbi:hypothetical protein CVU83_01205 [Candidatus Falkowbacteria bacterium HGW-Falkowbacteria-2]|uniref:DUF4197 domain-containing protein n=1 Tax=Candidatus Falkowbacteria bacterium HGW-Falkowbacteria-2 TaxID=2013769 RepID=A0A2N2E1U3_9BACT|nr:MAG: hypothetical protein CVU83_01205 [Candidatus Falkowbacteria bacterium HGW-Falkowbacteria-2]